MRPPTQLLLVPLMLILIPSCRLSISEPQTGGIFMSNTTTPNLTRRATDAVLMAANRSRMNLMSSGSLILLSEEVGTTASSLGTTASTTTASPRTSEQNEIMMIQYRRFQRPQRRDLPPSLNPLANVDSTSPACTEFITDEVMADKSIVFKSPNYPNNYPNNTDCVRRLTADPGYLLQLDFRDTFYMEPSEGCRFDYLEVRDGAHGYSTLRGLYCGQTFPPMLTSTDRYFWLRFHSDENIEYSGFKAVYRFIPRPTSGGAQPEMDMCYINVTGSEGFVNRSDIDRERVSMATTYKIPLDCMWVIEVEPGWKLEKPNDCESNFVDVFSARTDLPSRLKNFCGSIADAVTSESNILHVRFYADASAQASNFEALFTAFRDKGEAGCNPDEEYDCEDNTCIKKELRCNQRTNCRFKWDEDDCSPKLGSLGNLMEQDHIIIIMVIFSLIMCGMCTSFVFNCVRKLFRDHRIIREHMRQSREDRLDDLERKSQSPSMTLVSPVGVGVGLPLMTKGRSASRHSRSRSHSIEHNRRNVGVGDLSAENTPIARRHHHQDCFMPNADNTLIPMLLSRSGSTLPSAPAPAPANGDAIFPRHHVHPMPLPEPVTRGYDSGDELEILEDDLVLGLGAAASASASGHMPEMRDNECQTRESLFHNNNSSLSNNNDPSRSNSERSNTPPPPPPPPPAISRLINMKNSRNRPAPFSTFGYGDDGHASNSLRRGHPAPGEDPRRFRAEAVIEMDQNSSSGSSEARTGGAGAGGGAGPTGVPQERPFSVDSTKSAPDVIVTH